MVSPNTKSVSVRSTNWLGTLNNPDIALTQEYLQKWYKDTGATYVNGQLEKGKEGTVHVQYFVNYKKPGKTLHFMKQHCSRSHFEVVKYDNGASDYCLKEDTRLEGPWEFGLKPARLN